MKNASPSRVLLVFCIAWLAFLLGSEPGLTQDALEETEPLGQASLVILHPDRTATLSAEVQATVTRIHREMGQGFRKGSALISLDHELYLQEKKKQEALLASAETDYETSAGLYRQKSISEIEYATSRANLEVARTNLLVAKRRLKSCTIRAPYSGKVLELLVHENELVQPGQPLVEIVDDRMIRTKFLAPAELRKELTIGQVLPVRIQGVDETLSCKLTNMSPVLESNTGTFQVFGEIENGSNALRGGMTGEIFLNLAVED